MEHPGRILLAGVAIAVASLLGEGRASGSGDAFESSPYKDYKHWSRMNDVPVFSPTHGETFVVTCVNATGLTAAIEGRFPFPVGAVIVKEAFTNEDWRPGVPDAVFVMEKRPAGYDPAHGDWHWVRYNPDGTLWAEGPSAGQLSFCGACHQTAKVNDYGFGTETRMKVVETLGPTPCR